MIIFVTILLISIGIFLRILPFKYSKNLGVDNWFWLLYVETLKKEKKFPVRLKSFMLEIEEQWYPPLYPVILSLFGQKFINKNSRFIAPVTDCLQIIVVIFLTYFTTDNILITILSGMMYSVVPFTINYNIQLNPRGIGVFLVAIITLLEYSYIQTGNIKVYILILFLGATVLLLHKMSTQMMFFYFLISSIYERNIFVFLTIPFMIGVALIISGGFYWKVLKAHYDIVSFWNRNIKKLNAHQYYDSELYKKTNYKSNSLYKGDFKSKIKLIERIFAYNPFILVLFTAFFDIKNLSDFQVFNLIWVIIVYSWITLTTFVKPFKAMGSGLQYVYHGIIPLVILASSMLYGKNQFILVLLSIIIGFIFSIYSLIMIYIKFKKSSSNENKQDLLIDSLNYMKELPEDNIFCIPFQLPDITAYFTRKKVLWGGHGYGFKMLEPYFPVMNVQIEKVLKDFNINYILLDKSYLSNISDIITNEKAIKLLMENKKYSIYSVNKEYFI